MLYPAVPENLRDPLQRVAGYLNFSAGALDSATLAAWNQIYSVAIGDDPLSGPPAWTVVKDWLNETLKQLSQQQTAFVDHQRARRAIRMVWSELLPAYLDYHRDLLFHQEPEILFNGFFLARAASAVLDRLDDDSESDSIVAAAIEDLNDFTGYRPVATLENHRGEPYPHEFVCPVPLHYRGAGVTAGKYAKLIELALEALRVTDDAILHAAGFDLDRLDELALDPRAYDFDHPVNRRPNYHFGSWDERSVGQDGCYHRFVLRHVTLDALLSRARETADLDPEELLVESASVLAGTILMASGMTGWGPAAYGSDVSLATLMKPIANYRDQFYEDRLRHLSPAHVQRLAAERKTHHQPFGAARQHLNAALAKRRATQVQHAQLARLYARMGYPDAASRQSDVVAVPSARMLAQIDCDITSGLRALRAGRLNDAVPVTQTAFERLQRSIECGALVDPWNLLGFGGNFSLFPGPENSIHDNRADDLVYVVDQIFGYTARVWSEAAARDDQHAYQEMERLYREIAEWWRRYAAHTVESIEASDPLESYESAKLVSRALRLWHRGGAAAGDVKFWAPHADLFDSPRAYTLVISALLERRDFVPAMALLVHWLSRADEVGLSQSGSSLPRLSERWLLRLRGIQDPDQSDRPLSVDTTPEPPARGSESDWASVRRLFDYYEANAEHYWSAPRFRLNDGDRQSKTGRRDWEAELTAADDPDLEGDDDEENDLFAAAYEDMVYQDTTDDGHEGSVADEGGFGFGDEGSRDELQAESKRLTEHLSFLQSLARMWALAADMAVHRHQAASDQQRENADPASDDGNKDARDESAGERDNPVVGETDDSLDYLNAWACRARQNRIGLLELLDAVQNYPIRPSGSDKESLKNYDRQRLLRDSLMERIIGTAVEMSDARRLICGAIDAISDGAARAADQELAEDDVHAIALFAALIGGDTPKAKELFPKLLGAINNKSLLYIPLSRGGDPVKIYVARLRQRMMRHLVGWLPRRGLIAESCRLIETARMMEQNNPIGVGAVTEFDGLFADGFRSLVLSVVHNVRADRSFGRPMQPDLKKDPETSSSTSPKRRAESDEAKQNRIARALDEQISEALIPLLERLTEIMLASWLAHSQTLRLSPLEVVSDPRKWKSLVDFIQRYGDPLFTQTFLQLGNVRAVLHQGVGSWLQRALDEGDDQLDDTPLFRDLESGKLSIDTAASRIGLVYESVFDHHVEYVDYNSTTTQSDRGELIYMFLDFLRLGARYERIAWNLNPVMLAHEVLVHAGLENAAQTWRRSLSERIGAEAEIYVRKLQKLQSEYAMRMPTVADRINERFSRPMTIDRMRALIAPALADAEQDGASQAFDLLEQEAELLTRNPAGVGFDAPAWLTELEDEVEKLAKRAAASEIDPQSLMTIPIVPLSMDQLRGELNHAANQGRRLSHRDSDSSKG